MSRIATRVKGSEVLEAFKPSPVLAPYVTDIWAYDIPRAARAGEPARLVILPDGCPTLVFIYGAPLRARYAHQTFETRSAACGFHAGPVHLSCTGDVGGITVRLRPAGLAAFVPGSLEGLAERRVECRDIFSNAAIESLEDELAELPTALARVRRLETFLAKILRPSPADPLVAAALLHMRGSSARQAHTIHQLARDLCTTERTLERRFRLTVGASPKQFSSVVRLQRALQERAHGKAWSELALDAGYYDQAHLVREARRLFGAAPQALLAAEDSSLGTGFRQFSVSAGLDATIFR